MMRRRVENIIVGFDQFCQVLIYLGNYTPDETISGIIGRKIRDSRANWLEKTICFVLRRLQSKHCIKSIDNQEDIKGESL